MSDIQYPYYTIKSLGDLNCKEDKIPGYYVISTATINVEIADKINVHEVNGVNKKNKLFIQEIAKRLVDESKKKDDPPELVVHIHGYANSRKDARKRYEEAWEYVNSPDSKLELAKSNYVFIGYRWPAEPPLKEGFDSLKALPILPSCILKISSVVVISTILLLLITPWLEVRLNLLSLLIFVIVYAVCTVMFIKLNLPSKTAKLINLYLFFNEIALFVPVLLCYIFFIIICSQLRIFSIILCGLIIGIISALIILRLLTYSRDRFRASNYGVLDLVEFFQDLQAEKIRIEGITKSRIKISFIAHSLGCEVATQTIRILADVFDDDAINTVKNQHSSNISAVFTLGRLVLVAPDIPIESILTTRANFLKSSLIRCEEAYVFSNEADLALRLASTAANYFSFPSKDRYRGYKLGNVTVNRNPNSPPNKNGCQDPNSPPNKNGCQDKYGIVNVQKDKLQNPHQYLEIRTYQETERKTLLELSGETQLKENAIADCFTYFDCTDYTEEEPEKGILSFARKKDCLTLCDYFELCLAHFFGFPRKIDTHGGYFEGKFCRGLIHDLAFLGYEQLLGDKYYSNQDEFSNACKNRNIQVLLASNLLASKKIPHPCDEG
ncbi:alpha/beta hydrolase [Aliinostoc sp. HNIBRCY26]|uniref:alpha/beta hydrolase n=1 Tax=Aliinostoc sp. HNIBRCY26 TaxID=3418997 RepID=UPI003D034BFA